MSVYNLAVGITAVQTLSAVNTRGGSNRAVKPWSSDDNSNGPTRSQAFVVSVSGGGTVSATVQPVVSNDGVNWVNAAPAITVSGNADLAPVSDSLGTNQPFEWFGAYVTAISGTNASCNVKMSA